MGLKIRLQQDVETFQTMAGEKMQDAKKLEKAIDITKCSSCTSKMVYLFGKQFNQSLEMCKPSSLARRKFKKLLIQTLI